MIGVRLPASIIKKIGKVAEVLSTNRSATIRLMLLDALKHGRTSLLLSRRWGGRFTDQIVRSVIAEQRAEFAEAAAARPGATSQADINALRAAEEAAQLRARLVDRVQLQKARKPISRPRAVTEIEVMPAERIRPPPRRSQRKGRKLSEAEVRAAVERAASRSSEGDPSR
jgi:hypothetical protein